MFRGHAFHTFRVLIALGPFALSFLRDYRRWFWFGAPLPRTTGFHERRASRLVTHAARAHHDVVAWPVGHPVARWGGRLGVLSRACGHSCPREQEEPDQHRSKS